MTEKTPLTLQHRHLRCAFFGLSSLLSACQFMPIQSTLPIAAAPVVLPIPIASHEFTLNSAQDDVVGSIQRIAAREDDTLSDIARRFNLGYEEIVNANPGVDPWLPKAGTSIILPTQFVLPNAPRQGLVINLAAMRLFYFPKVRPGEPQRVITHPVGIGRIEWKTPEGTTRVAAKEKNPSWVPTPSIRKEHAKNGDPLPAVVPPGPNNPMGSHVLRLDWPSYAIHGTDKPPSIGLRGSHGCLRMYPEDIAGIYHTIPVGTPVQIVNQPRLAGWYQNHLYLQTYPILEDDTRNHGKLLIHTLSTVRSSKKAKLATRTSAKIHQALINEAISYPRATAIPITQSGITVQTYLDHVRSVQNTLPFNATWNGDTAQQTTIIETMKIFAQEISPRSEQDSRSF